MILLLQDHDLDRASGGKVAQAVGSEEPGRPASDDDHTLGHGWY